ncbi:MAG: GTPase [Saprospiraceae bacterium]|nr:MAG: GTPase [Saprospiraceae bacterium]
MIEINIQKKLQTAHGAMNLNAAFELQEGKITTIYGSSGAGKTTILTILAGLLTPETGTIKVNNEIWLDTFNKKKLPIQKRSIGFVFQNYALFPNMTVIDNLRYALRKGEEDAFVRELITIMELEQLQNRKPETLSGGQKQRVALARALVRRPKLLLLDEPLSALDPQMRSKLQDLILEVHHSFQLTTVLVSHDLAEVFKMSNWVMELENGKITRQGKPETVFAEHEATDHVQLVGKLLSNARKGKNNHLEILIGKNVVKIVTSQQEHSLISAGDEVVVVFQALQPVVRKLVNLKERN